MAERPGTIRVLVVDVLCLACGQADRLNVANLHDCRGCPAVASSVVAAWSPRSHSGSWCPTRATGSTSGAPMARRGVADHGGRLPMPESRATLFATAHELLDIVEQVRPQDLTQGDKELLRKLAREIQALLRLAC
jgi:hypothetical protein